ncbi:MAG: hypothetical protein SFH39_03510 [Candidatus Magnetobacterium sp. LHC-1]|nr:zinc ribbon domain-containing protein [Nitrospirota bacterium]
MSLDNSCNTFSCGCGGDVKSPTLKLLKCRQCGHENEVWSDDDQPVCRQCGDALGAIPVA